MGCQLLLTEPALGPAVALILLGEGVRLWAASHIGRPSRTRDGSVGPLVRSGPYARLQNPLYVGNTLMAAGFGALSSPPLGLAWALVTALFYVPIVRWERQRLQATHGDAYAAYRDGATSDAPADWRRGVRSERSTLLVWSVALTALGLRSLL